MQRRSTTSYRLTLELSGGEAVRLERDVRRQHSYTAVCEHDSAALKARQCCEACGLRAKNEPLATSTTLQRTARTTKYEDALCTSARKTRQTTKRAKDINAGQPGTADAALPARSRDVKRARDNAGKMLCRLTLELSGGEAVRLERVVSALLERGGHDADLPTDHG
jgi:hypothetical protein